MIALLLSLLTIVLLDETPADVSNSIKLDLSLARVAAKEASWRRALASMPVAQRPGMAYLLADLPLRDLETLPPDALALNVALAYHAREETPWGKSLPEEVFLDSVLPHASVTEPRDPLRREFHDRYLPLVKDCRSSGEAALKINERLFKDYEVTYNTRRLRTDQCSKESIAQKMATCTGLSIMLVEACRSVGAPARLAGIHSWPGRGGNHTWVEVWDKGWHFVGAAEPDGKGLDHAWFVGDASNAIKTSPKNAIYAVTFRNTGEHFPLAWNPDAGINAENVTDRYKGSLAQAPKGPRLMVEVRRGGERVEAEVKAFERGTGMTRLSAKSLGPRADVNQHLSTTANLGESFLVVARFQGRSASCCVAVQEDTVVKLDLDRPASDKTRLDLEAILADRFGTDGQKREIAGKLLAEVPVDDMARRLAWKAYQASARHEALRKEFDSKMVKTPLRSSEYLWRHVGEKPREGWGLVIAMHGGGGAPKEVNDQQWRSMFNSYYKEHPEVGGYVYLSLRAPNDEWNGFYDDAICPLVERLIRQFVLFGEVNPDRVYALGASHGGYGAFVIGTKIPDRFAAVHASASAPTDGETMGENLRNLPFTFMVGEKDTAYGRAERCQAFAKQVEGWRASHGGYPGGFEWKPGVGHSVPDRDKVGEMLKSPPRQAWPKQLVWVQSDDVLKHFYWMESLEPQDKRRIEASVVENTITIKADAEGDLAVWLDGELVDLAKPVTIKMTGGETTTITPTPSLGTYCLGLQERGDPRLAGPSRVMVRKSGELRR